MIPRVDNYQLLVIPCGFPALQEDQETHLTDKKGDTIHGEPVTKRLWVRLHPTHK